MKPELKETVIKYLESADERLLKMIKVLIESYQEEEGNPSTLNEEHCRGIDIAGRIIKEKLCVFMQNQNLYFNFNKANRGNNL